jgi:phenylacetate-coenzyme A ligase PaaK-like adenylate-forming protein
MPRDRVLVELEQRVLAAIRAGAGAPMADAAFNRLALDVFAFQYARNESYRRYCDTKNATPATLRDWHDVPAVPTTAFKELPLSCFPPEQAELVFTTSGTTQGGRQGTHYIASAKLYDASLLHFEAALLPDGARPPALVLAQSPDELPHSSLSHMFGVIARGLTEDCAYYVDAGSLHAEALARDLSLAEAEAKPVMLLGTAFAFVHFLDYCAERGLRWALPKRSRLMDTGGFKGRSREVPRDELYRLYREVFGLQAQYMVNEYGMTELCSQFYDATLIDHQARRHEALRKLAPNWCRVQVLNPETMQPAADGEIGVLRFFDLSNLYSVAAIQTEDLGRSVADGFEVLGRAQGAEARGCSVALDDLLLAQQQRA